MLWRSILRGHLCLACRGCSELFTDQGGKEGVCSSVSKATNGDADSQLELGIRNLLGRGVATEDAVQARNWFLKSADQGNVTARFSLGEMYSTGWGIPEDKARAAIWYRKAADQGLATAQYDLGNMYETGREIH